jgi:hypothetical protein
VEVIMDNKKLIVAVAYDEVNNTYSVDVSEGTSVPEVAFAVSVVIKCLERDNVMSKKDFMEFLNRYLTDEFYNEVTTNDN